MNAPTSHSSEFSTGYHRLTPMELDGSLIPLSNTLIVPEANGTKDVHNATYLHRAGRLFLVADSINTPNLDVTV